MMGYLYSLDDVIKMISAPLSAVCPPTVFVFDMDGTLIDTDESNLNSYREAVLETLDIEFAYSLSDRFNRNSLKEVVPSISEDDINRVVARKEEVFVRHISETRLNLQLVSLVTAVHKRFHTVLLTESGRGRAEMLLDHYNLGCLFSEKYYKEDFLGTDKYSFLYSNSDFRCCRQIIFENEKENLSMLVDMKIPNQYIVPVNCW